MAGRNSQLYCTSSSWMWWIGSFLLVCGYFGMYKEEALMTLNRWKWTHAAHPLHWLVHWPYGCVAGWNGQLYCNSLWRFVGSTPITFPFWQHIYAIEKKRIRPSNVVDDLYWLFSVTRSTTKDKNAPIGTEKDVWYWRFVGSTPITLPFRRHIYAIEKKRIRTSKVDKDIYGLFSTTRSTK
jgi:hypothetical protein